MQSRTLYSVCTTSVCFFSGTLLYHVQLFDTVDIFFFAILMTRQMLKQKVNYASRSLISIGVGQRCEQSAYEVGSPFFDPEACP